MDQVLSKGGMTIEAAGTFQINSHKTRIALNNNNNNKNNNGNILLLLLSNPSKQHTKVLHRCRVEVRKDKRTRKSRSEETSGGF